MGIMAVQMNSYMPLLMIPAGALLFLAISKASDFNALNKGVCIRFDDTAGGEAIAMGDGLIASAIGLAARENNDKFAVSGMPLALNEIAGALARETGDRLQVSGAGAVDALRYALRGQARVYRDFVCTAGRPYRGACARSLYEKLMDEGALKICEPVSVDRFLGIVGAVCCSDLSVRMLRKRSGGGAAMVCACSRDESRSLGSAACRYGKGSALMLFLEANCMLEVVDCWR